MQQYLKNLFKPGGLFLLALILGSFLRLYQLGEIPFGYTWDEAAITYDAWGIADWHRDQYANFMPWVFKSYGDYKAPFFIYLLATSFLVTGVQEISIRLFSAVAGIALIVTVYLLGQKLLPKQPWFAAVAALLVAISPWHMPMSRVGYEANLATTMVTLGTFLLLSVQSVLASALGAFLLAISIYTYQSTKITVPLLFGLLFVIRVYLTRNYERSLKHAFVPLLIFGLGLVPLYWTMEQGGAERGKQALVLFENNELVSPSTLSSLLIENIQNHFSPGFFWLGKQESLRHLVPGFGVLFALDVILIALGLFLGRNRKMILFVGTWAFLGLLPSILSRGDPNAIRAALALPPLLLLSAYGLTETARRVRPIKLGIGVIVIIVGAYLITTARFISTYFGSYPVQAALDFQYGYRAALAIAKEQHDVDRYVMTDAYKQPYIFALLYQRYTPEEFQAGALANFMFKPIRWPEQEPQTVYIGTPQEIPPADPAVVGVVTIPGTDTPVFVVAKHD